MITEDYVSFELAKLLKEKWFDEPCYMFYKSIIYLGAEANSVRIIELSVSEDEPFNNSIQGVDFQGNDTEEYAMPTLQMAMKWLRIEHNLFIEPYYSVVCGFRSSVTDTKTGKTIYTQANEDVYYSSPEASCESIIQYCLKHLI